MPPSKTSEVLKGLGALGGILQNMDQKPAALDSFKALMSQGFDISKLKEDRGHALDFLLEAAVKLGAVQSYGKILRGAADVIGREGVDVTVQDILTHAGVSRRTFYQSFKNTEQVLETLYALVLCIGRILLRQRLMNCQSKDELFHEISSSYGRFYEVGGMFMGQVAGESFRQRSSLNVIYREHVLLVSEWTRDILKEQLNAAVSEAQIRMFYISLTAIVQDFRLSSLSSDEDRAEAKAALKSFTDIYLSGLDQQH